MAATSALPGFHPGGAGVCITTASCQTSHTPCAHQQPPVSCTNPRQSCCSPEHNQHHVVKRPCATKPMLNRYKSHLLGSDTTSHFNRKSRALSAQQQQRTRYGGEENKEESSEINRMEMRTASQLNSLLFKGNTRTKRFVRGEN